MKAILLLIVTTFLCSMNVYAQKTLPAFQASYDLKIKKISAKMTRKLTITEHNYCYTSTMDIKVLIFSRKIIEQSCGIVNTNKQFTPDKYNSSMGDKSLITAAFNYKDAQISINQVKGRQNKAFVGDVPFKGHVYDNLSYQLQLAQAILNQLPQKAMQYNVLAGHQILLYTVNIAAKDQSFQVAGKNFVVTKVTHSAPKETRVDYWFDQKTGLMLKFVIYSKGQPVMSALLSE